MENKRIHWIDWAKTIGIMIVVFCHVPQYNTLLKQFFCSMQMPLFFMLSGYLHKIPNNMNDSIRKYWRTLIIPYMLFQFIFYPYYFIRGLADGDNLNGFYNAVIKPFVQCVWGIPIDGITWFIYALIIMKLLIDLVNKAKIKNTIVTLYCLISICLAYFIWKDDKVNINFTIDSFFNFFPFFILGYTLRKNKYLAKANESNIITNFTIAIISIALSLMILILSSGMPYIIQRINFYLLGIIGSLVIVALSICINKGNRLIYTISYGTIIILGIHWMFIGLTNFVLERIMHIKDIIYNIPESIIIVFCITFINYFIIQFCKKYFPIILGGRR
jgi:fucose 4-O-acetylase-like acetyltransferase